MRRRNGMRRLPQSLSDRCQNSVSTGRTATVYTDARGRWTGPLPCALFALSLLKWSRFIREATMRFGVDTR